MDSPSERALGSVSGELNLLAERLESNAQRLKLMGEQTRDDQLSAMLFKEASAVRWSAYAVRFALSALFPLCPECGKSTARSPAYQDAPDGRPS